MPRENTSRNRVLVDLLLLSAITVPICFFGMGQKPVESTLEERVAITGREMWLSGDWIVPRMNGELRLQKPPLAYWLVAGCATLRGKFDDVTLRLPFAVLMLGSSLFAWGTARILSGGTAGFIAGLVLLTSALGIKEGRMATTDAAMFFSAMGAWFFYTAARSRRERGLPAGRLSLGFYFFLGLGGLAKGPVILVVCVLPPVLEAVFLRSAAPLLPLKSLAGICLFLLMSFSWPTAVIWRLSEEGGGANAVHQWYLESFGKILPSTGVEDGYRFQRHTGPWHFYFPRLFTAFGAWSPFLVAALFLQARAQGLARLAWISFMTIFVFFSLISEKKSGYMLPLLGPGAVLISQTIALAYLASCKWLRPVTAVLAGIAALGFLLSLGGAFWPQALSRVIEWGGGEDARRGWDVFTARPALFVTLGALPLVGIILFRRLLSEEDARAPFAVFGVTLSLFTSVYNAEKLGLASEEGDMRQAARVSLDVLSADQPLYCLGSRWSEAVGSLPAGLVYYLNRRVRLVDEMQIDGLKDVPGGAALFVSEGRLEKYGAEHGSLAGNQEARPAEAWRLAGAFEGYRVLRIVNPGAESKWSRIHLLVRKT